MANRGWQPAYEGTRPLERPPMERPSAPPAVPVMSAPATTGPRMAEGGNFPFDMPLGHAESLIMLNVVTGQVLAAKDADQARPIASTQKLLSALVILESGPLDRRVQILPQDCQCEPTKLYIKAGETYTRGDLLRAMLIKSANDAAQALARDCAGSIPAFAQRMNMKARQLGCYQSHFVNPHGLTAPGQTSSARDLSKIAYAAYKHPFIRQTVDCVGCSVSTPSGSKQIETTNKLLKKMPACNGMKTGYTRASGKCLVSSAVIGGQHIILVQLGSESRFVFDDAERLMLWGASRGRGRPDFAVNY